MSMKLTPSPLVGSSVLLVPLAADMLAELTQVALGAPQVWAHIPYPMASAEDVRSSACHALSLQARGELVAYTTRLRESGELVGGTTLRVVDPGVPSLEIGGTWIVPAHQRTRVNSEVKLLQLAHAFDVLGAARVELKTDVRNERSQAAIRRLGAVYEGTLRNHMRRKDGSLRDSVLFSIVAADWPTLRARLEPMLQRELQLASTLGSAPGRG
jgi:RimJ/RimL family protein N-acetyltransferase